MYLLTNPLKFEEYLTSIKRQTPLYIEVKDFIHLEKILLIPKDTFYFKGNPALNTSKIDYTNPLDKNLLNVLCHNGTDKFYEMVQKVVKSLNNPEAYTSILNLSTIIRDGYKIITDAEPAYAWVIAYQAGANARAIR